MKRILSYLIRKNIRKKCNRKGVRTKWLLLDNTFNDYSEPVDNFTLFKYLLENTKEDAYYVMRETHEKFNSFKKEFGNRIIALPEHGLGREFINSLENTKYILDSFQVLSNKFNIGDILCSSKIHYIYTGHGINFFKTGFIERSNVISDENFTEIVLSNVEERKLLNNYYNYPNDRVIYSGLARWDNATPKEREILLFFTFRSYLNKVGEYSEDFEYYKNLKELLSSPRLSELSDKYHFKTYVALHHETERFSKAAYDGIEVLSQDEIGVVKNRASLLVTDYSSMCFDFMVNDRPVIFYRLDSQEEKMDDESVTNNNRVEQLNDKIYNVTYDVESVLDKIEEYARANFLVGKKEKGINSTFFTKRQNICEDLVQRILQLKPTDLYNGISTPIGKNISLNRTKAVRCVGLSRPEPAGRWSASEEVCFYLNLPVQDKDRVVSFNLNSIIDIDCRVDVFGEVAYEGNIFTIPAKNKISVYISKETIKKRKGRVKVRFRIALPVQPRWVKDSKDSRYLGVFFRSMRVI